MDKYFVVLQLAFLAGCSIRNENTGKLRSQDKYNNIDCDSILKLIVFSSDIDESVKETNIRIEDPSEMRDSLLAVECYTINEEGGHAQLAWLMIDVKHGRLFEWMPNYRPLKLLKYDQEMLSHYTYNCLNMK